MSTPTPAPAPADLATFLSLSAVLTGFSELDLQGTGVVAIQFNAVQSKIGPAIMQDLLAAARTALAAADPASAISASMWADPKVGPVVKNIVTLWYIGSWTPMPYQWQETYNWSAPDFSQGAEWISPPQPYEESLVWRAIYAHPPGAKPTGFGSWTEPPDEVRTKLVRIGTTAGGDQ
jgi:hypothetical protein